MQFNQCDQRGQGLLTATDFAKFLVTKVFSCVSSMCLFVLCSCACVLLSGYLPWYVAVDRLLGNISSCGQEKKEAEKGPEKGPEKGLDAGGPP